MSYHQKAKRCCRCGLRCTDVEWRVLLDEYLCWECKSRLQLENTHAAWRGRGKGDRRAKKPVRLQIEVEMEGLDDEPLPSPYLQLDMFE